MSLLLSNIFIQPLILEGSGVQPTMPTPSTLVHGDDGFDSSTNIVKGQQAYNIDDDKWYYRSGDSIEELVGTGSGGGLKESSIDVDEQTAHTTGATYQIDATKSGGEVTLDQNTTFSVTNFTKWKGGTRKVSGAFTITFDPALEQLDGSKDYDGVGTWYLWFQCVDDSKIKYSWNKDA